MTERIIKLNEVTKRRGAIYLILWYWFRNEDDVEFFWFLWDDLLYTRIICWSPGIQAKFLLEEWKLVGPNHFRYIKKHMYC